MTPQQTQASYSRERLKRLRSALRARKLDALITFDPADLRWLTAWPEVFDDEPAHMGIITTGKAIIHTDSRYSVAMQAKNKQDIWHIDAQPMRHAVYVKSVFKKSRKQEVRLGYASHLRLDQYKALRKECAQTPVKLVETKGLFAELRAVKDEEEIKLSRKAQLITDKAFAELLTWTLPGMRELELANKLDYTLRSLGAQGLAFDTIAASGPHSALPHARPTTRRLRKGDFVVLDFGARYHDYCADMTRTLVIGKATTKQHRMYEAVLDAHTKAKAGIKAGITGKQAHECAVEALKERGFEKLFTHSLGHGVGIEVHEQPALTPSNNKPLEVGNIVTVEPGAYLAGFGGVRIEDFGLVEKKGFVSFTRSPHELIEIA